MGEFFKNPYGTSSFEIMVQQKKAFVDKTMFIKTLDQLDSDYPILLRPRRFGKSTFVSMLKYFYDRRLLDVYDKVFAKTKIYQENLPSHNTYHVIVFDFSYVSGNRKKELYENFSSALVDGISDFQSRYPSFEYSIDPDSYSNPILLINTFFLKYREWGKQHPEFFSQNQQEMSIFKNLYIIIDEYDNFANEILNTNRVLFKDITSGSGLLKDFYKTIKAATATVIAKTFITGVSSISLDSITSGFNIATNITNSPKFNEYAGMTEQELRNIIMKLVDYKSYHIDLDHMIDSMRQTYNGYAFTKKAKQKLFNNSLCLNYIREINDNQEYIDPSLVFDEACNYDPTKLYDLVKNTEPSQLNKIIQTYFNDQFFELTNLSKSLNINQINRYDYDTILSILFYLGYLTIKPEYEQIQVSEKLLLVCPNKVMRKIFRKCFVEYYFYEQDDFLKSFSFDVTSIENDSEDLSLFIASCENYLGGRLTNQHLFRMTESELVAILKTKLESIKSLNFKDEYAIQVPAIGEKFIDLYIENQAQSIYIIEFKYISKAALERNAKLVDQKRVEAEQQLKIYKKATSFQNKNVRAYSMIFADCKCVHYAKV